MAKKDGEITYVISADNSNLEADLDEAEEKVKKSRKEIEQAAEQSGEKVEQETKRSVSRTTRTHEQGNEDIEKSHKKSGEERKKTERDIGEAMSQIAESACGEIGVSFEKITSVLKSPVAAGTAGAAALAGVGVAAVNSPLVTEAPSPIARSPLMLVSKSALTTTLLE